MVQCEMPCHKEGTREYENPTSEEEAMDKVLVHF